MADPDEHPHGLLLAGDGVARFPEEFAALEHAEIAGPEFAAPSVAALVALATARAEREEFEQPGDLRPALPPSERRRDRLGRACRRRAGDLPFRAGNSPFRAPFCARRRVMSTEPDVAALTVHILPMRRRHLRSVLRIEQQVYPRPWSSSLFMSELAAARHARVLRRARRP